MRDKTFRKEVIAGLIAVAVIVPLVVAIAHLHTSVPAKPDEIVSATLGIEPFRDSTDGEIEGAIERFGDPNGFSTRHQCSFLYAAVAGSRTELVKWLLARGANPNPKGSNPLLACIRANDSLTAKSLIRAGSQWDLEVAPGKTVLQVALQQNPRIVEQLKR
jgi:hypothetical protein